jgi:Lysine methyltransferase
LTTLPEGANDAKEMVTDSAVVVAVANAPRKERK